MKQSIILLMLITTIAWTQPRWMDDKDAGSPHGRMMFIEKLKLTDDQQKQFDKLHSDLEKKLIALRSQVQTLRLDIRDAFREDKPDKGKIESKLSEITKLQNEMKINRLAFWFDVNKILTPDQQKMWKEHHMMLDRGFGNHLGWKRGEMRMGMGWGYRPHCFPD